MSPLTLLVVSNPAAPYLKVLDQLPAGIEMAIGNTLEALVGAVYIDRGWASARYLIHRRILDPFVNFNKVENEVISYKSLLIEEIQK